MNLKAAAVDIGTNSCRLLIGTKNSKNNLEILSKKLEITRLGEGVDQNRSLKNEAVARVLTVLKNYKEIISDYKVDKVRIVGTSALRDVNNSDLLSKKIAKLGFKLEIITGKKEAKLNYLGAVSNLAKNFLLIDIGGGSTEFIWSENKKIKFKSLDIGCVRLTEKFVSVRDSKFKIKENKKIKNYVDQILKKNLNLNNNFKLKGVGGTITTLAAVKSGLEVYEGSKIENISIKKVELDKIINKLSSLNLEKRKQVKGLQPKRADIIIAGLIILKSILKHTKRTEISVSDHDLLYGLLKEELNFGGF